MGLFIEGFLFDRVVFFLLQKWEEYGTLKTGKKVLTLHGGIQLCLVILNGAVLSTKKGPLMQSGVKCLPK